MMKRSVVFQFNWKCIRTVSATVSAEYVVHFSSQSRSYVLISTMKAGAPQLWTMDDLKQIVK